MQFFLTGAESTAHLDTLKSCGVHRVAVSINNLARHTAHYGDWASDGRLNGLDWVVYADSTAVPPGPVLELLHGAPTEPEAVIGPIQWANTWLGESDILFLPLWDGRDPSELRETLELYDGVVLPDAVVDNAQAVRNARSSKSEMQIVGGLTGRSKGVDRFDLVVSSAWWAVPKHGETQVWTGSRLVRLNAEDKHAKRQRYADDIEALGVDVSAVLSDDAAETSKLAIRSWLAMEDYLNRGRRLESASSVVTNEGSDQGGSIAPVVVRGAVSTRHVSGSAPTNVLPVMATSDVEMDDGNFQAVITSRSDTLLQCDTCVLSASCPGYQANSSCHYQIPVVIRTKEQQRAVLQTVTEIQTQRVMMGQFREQVTGEYDPDVGKEMDRLVKMFKSKKDIEETQSFSLHMSASDSAGSGGGGAISRLFGPTAGQNAQILDVPINGEDQVGQALS